MLPDRCHGFRETWTAHVESDARADAGLGEPGVREPGVGEPGGHAGECADCRAWAESLARRIALLRALRPRVAPPVLDEVVAERLAEPREAFDPRLAHVLSALPAHAAPAELEARLEDGLENEPIVAGVLRSMQAARTPHVLERLVAEELCDPGLASARRFAGDLERAPVPPSLTHRVATELGRLVHRRRILGSLATAAAAVLLLWVGARRMSAPEAPSERYSFQVRRVESTAALGGLGRALGDALSGGISNAAPLPPAPSGSSPERSIRDRGEAR